MEYVKFEKIIFSIMDQNLVIFSLVFNNTDQDELSSYFFEKIGGKREMKVEE